MLCSKCFEWIEQHVLVKTLAQSSADPPAVAPVISTHADGGSVEPGRPQELPCSTGAAQAQTPTDAGSTSAEQDAPVREVQAPTEQERLATVHELKRNGSSKRDAPAFGETIRARKLGYQWSINHDAFVRVAVVGSDLYRIDSAPAGQIPNHSGYTEPYIEWWSFTRSLLLDLEAANDIHAPDWLVVLFVDENGRKVSDG